MKGEVAVLLVIGAILIGLAYSGLFSSVGFTTLSLSKIDFVSSIPEFNRPMWALFVQQWGMGQSATLYISQDDFEEQTGQSVDAPLSLTISGSEQTCEYPIKLDSTFTPIYELQLQEWGCAWYDENVANQKCPNKIAGGKYTASFTCFCIDRITLVNDIAYIDNPYVHTTTAITVSGKGETYTKTFDTKGQIRGWLDSNNRVYVVWNGYLDTGEVCDKEDLYYAFYDGIWKIGNKFNYDQYVNVNSNFVTNYYNTNGDRNAIQALVNDYNTKSRLARTVVSFGTIKNSFSKTDAVITKQLTTYNKIPLWTFYINADWIRIYQPAPDVSIQSVTSNCFLTNGYITVALKNNGEDGNVDVWAECETPFRYAGRTEQVSLATGETRTIHLDVTFEHDTTQTTYGTCTVHINDGFHQRSKTIQVCAMPNLQCSPIGKKVCSGNVIKECRGTGWEVVEVCEDTCTYDAFGNPVCAIGEGVAPCRTIFGIIPDIPCLIGNWWGVHGTSATIILILLAILILFILFRR